MNVAQLSYVNEQEIHRCVNRSTEFSSAPCAANTPAGPILFCKQKPRSNSNESCCQFWLCSQTRRNKCPNGVILAKVVLASFVTTTSACNSVQSNAKRRTCERWRLTWDASKLGKRGYKVDELPLPHARARDQ